MKLRNLLIACYLLVSAVSLAAQSGEAAADPISGTWTGSMGPSETDRHPINVELKFDGKASISGTITGPPYPGDIKTGTFDPRTGALKLEVVVRNDDRTGVVFEGTVVQGTATGRVMFNNQAGTFIITKGAGTSAAAQPGAGDAATALRKSFTEVSAWVTKAADLVPAEKYTYRPAPSVRTFGQLIGHIADSYNYYCATAAGRKVQWSDGIEKGTGDKASLVQKLKQSTDACNAAYGGAGEAGPLVGNVGHTNLHYGNIITYMRMLGLVPPSS
jgi:DinB family protein